MSSGIFRHYPELELGANEGQAEIVSGLRAFWRRVTIRASGLRIESSSTQMAAIWCALSLAFAMTTSFRMIAVMATRGFLPALRRRL